MITYKIVPQFRDNCIIHGKEELLKDFKLGDTVFLISNQPTKTYSVVSKIDGIEYGEEPIIFIDKRNLDKLSESDEVSILKYNPPEAQEVCIDISNEFSLITRGDWTSNIRPSLKNKLVDLGQEVSFLIPWEGGPPIIGTGVIDSTIPYPPAYIGDRTRIVIEKYPLKLLSAIKEKKMLSKERRVDILNKQVKKDTVLSLRSMKFNKFPNRGQKYGFERTNPKHLFKSVLNLMKHLESIEDPVEEVFDDKQQDYFASAVFLDRQEQNNFQIIDIQVISSGKSGTLIVWVTAENNTLISKTLKRLDERITQLKHVLEQKVEIISAQCPECGGELPIKDIDIYGMVECCFCNKISKIPKVLRY